MPNSTIRFTGKRASNAPQVHASMPRAIYVELTDLCNLTCPMCRCNPVKGNILPLPLFTEMASTLFPHAEFVDLRGWGESTIIPNFEAYLDVALSYPARVKLITNGVAKRPELWRRLGRDGITVGVSFDAAEPALFKTLRGGANYHQVLEHLRIVADAQQSAGHDTKALLYFCITASGSNLDQLDRIVEVGMTLGVRRFKIEPLNAADDDPDRLERHAARVPAVLERLAALSAEHGLLIELSSSLVPDGTRADAVRKVCIHPWEYLYINSRGRLGFCDHLNGLEQYTFGSWQAEGFEAFWNGPAMRRLRDEHLRRLSGEAITQCTDCNWCYERRYMDLEDWIEPAWSAYRVTV
ncbi:radical SAM/SPASM domain-containing protein [Trinickia terrae]|uniref:Radical SAM/SPASM domain-containing protein n=1 Tax=Trinickia terrae TaxID=2571161 RepID=A0A4U1I273_9BURK|nr:radical SAM protein [Trinickia terrae]TKC87276.1 radical SAM/SPASM domain-containing protein [Trinickia terrae]